MPLKISQFLALVLFTSTATAAPNALVRKTENCDAALSSVAAQANPLDYEASDLEGHFLEIIQKIQDAGSVPPSRLEYYVQDLLNLKASFLNQIGGLVPYAMAHPDAEKRSRVIKSVYQMLSALGVPPKIYGLNADAQGRIALPNIPKSETAVIANDNQQRSPPIGFLAPLDPASIASRAPATDLAAGVQRSVGFAKFTYRTEAPPSRRTGEIKMGIAAQNQSILVVHDTETGKMYFADIRILRSSGSELEGKRYVLDFSKDAGSWIVRVDNLNNPTGRIGFL